MKIWRRLKSFIYERHAPCAWCQVQVAFTGEPALDPLEAMILTIADGQKHASFHWLEDRLAEVLYADELRRGAWATDVGVWGPAIFHREASLILRGLRPEFGAFEVEGKLCQSVGKLDPYLRSWPAQSNQI
ncbi:MAG: hypothetical protein Q7O66_15740 [Dehalococcoidia bacterium]|nr:hypothetical protein [Dehalococcoidia bacterium]